MRKKTSKRAKSNPKLPKIYPKKNRDLDFLKKENKLISELEWIKDISYKIDNENHNWMKKYMDLKVDYEAQENDRQMLLK